MITPILGRPGIQSGKTVTYRQVFKQPEDVKYLPGGGVMDKAAQDPGNDNTLCLRAGNLVGQITSSKKWQTSIMGVTITAAIANGDTSLTLSAAVAAELVRRQGTSGTFKLTGPPTAAGVVRTVTITYSAVNTTTGVVTMTTASVNEVQTVAFPIASTGGSVALQLWDPRSGNYVQTAAAAWSATDATYLANIQAKLDLAFGAANIVVVTAQAATDTDSALVFTYSGTGVAGVAVTNLPIVTTLPTSSTSYTVARTTTGVDGRFIVGSFVQPTDGSETPKSVIPDGSGILMTVANAADVDFPLIPYRGLIQSDQIINWPSDTSLRAWIVNSLINGGVRFEFDHLTSAA